MASKELLMAMNKAISMEIQVSIQYMWQHVQVTDIKYREISDKFKEIAIEEMKHAELIAERIFALGELPTTESSPVHVGEDLKEMLSQDIKDEKSTVELYKEVIGMAEAERDHDTSELFTSILKDEEDHLDFFTSTLEEV
jgi:bacterioferritin